MHIFSTNIQTLLHNFHYIIRNYGTSVSAEMISLDKCADLYGSILTDLGALSWGILCSFHCHSLIAILGRLIKCPFLISTQGKEIYHRVNTACWPRNLNKIGDAWGAMSSRGSWRESLDDEYELDTVYTYMDLSKNMLLKKRIMSFAGKCKKDSY